MVQVVQTLFTGVKMAFVEMASNKLRSFLSILGVLLGVASLVAILLLVGGVNTYLNDKMGDWVGNIWFVSAEKPDNAGSSWSRSPGLKLSDGDALKQNNKVKQFYEIIDREESVQLGRAKARIFFIGIDQQSLEKNLEECYISRGRNLTTEDYAGGQRVCIISWRVAERLSQRNRPVNGEAYDPLGKLLPVGGNLYKIVGVFSPNEPDYAFWRLKRSVYAPIVTVQRLSTGVNPDPGALQVSLGSWDELMRESQFVSKLLQSEHRGIEDFELRTMDWFEQVKSMMENASLLMLIISGISLLAGGLSIMNVMLSSISERIQEIGIRKSLGARNSQVFWQFIAESVTLSCVGAFFGMLIGLIPLFFKEAITASTDGAVEPTLMIEHLMIVTGVVISIGILFGLYPAIKAAGMDPVEALRYE